MKRKGSVKKYINKKTKRIQMRQLLKAFFTERIYFFLPPKPILFRGRFYIFRRAGTFVLNLIFRFAKLFIYFSKTNNSKKRKRGIE